MIMQSTLLNYSKELIFAYKIVILNSMDKKILNIILALCLVSCSLSGGVLILNPGCKRFETSGLCAQCSERYYKDANGICQPVNHNCKAYNPKNGACTSCYDGFSIIQDVCLPIPDDQILALAVALSNCNQIGDNGTCKRCSGGFYFDSNRICRKIPDTCADFNINLGKCQGCYQGYSLNQKNQCIFSIIENNDPGCSRFENNKCVRCSNGYYFDSNQKCRVIPPTCQNFDISTYRCKQCYPGYVLDQNNECIIDKPAQIDPGCAKFENGKCIKCSSGYYFDKSNVCKVIPPTCSNFNIKSLICQECYKGYQLDKDRNCVLAKNVPSDDPGCSKFQNGKCTQCSFGYYFDKNRVCRLISPLCGNFDVMNERCLACYPGYVLDINGNCIVSVATNTDPGCSKFQNGKCVKCSFGYYFNKAGVCKMIPPVCKSFDSVLEKCKECYPGYVTDATGTCVQSAVQTIDPGCSLFQKKVCIKCSIGFYFDKNRQCKAVPSTCSSFDSVREVCLSCYEGYSLDSSNNCIKKVDSVSDLGCNRFQKGKCVSCSVGYYFTSSGICLQIPSTCRNFDTVIGLCKSCYDGYQLDIKNQCKLKAIQNISDSNCKQFKNNKCIQCSQGAYFDSQGKCVLIDPLCKRFNQNTRRCQQCYPGFEVDQIRNVCKQSQLVLSDPNCKIFKNNQCLECSFRYYKDVTSGKCKIIDPSCRLYNINSGQCTACYDGYKLSNNDRFKCQRDTTAENQNCAERRNNKCVKCAFGSYFNSNGICKNVDPLCSTWNQLNGDCKTCYPSFELSNGKCILSTKQEYTDQNCAQYNERRQCSRCSKGFYFGSNNACIQVDPLCSTFDSNFGRCLTCYSGYKISNGRCIQDVQAISDLNCAKFKNSVCVECSRGSYFNSEKRCQVINPQCLYFNLPKKRCEQCYPGYVVFDGECVKSTKDKLCAQWKQSICIRCVNRAYFTESGSCEEVSQYCKDFDVFDGDCLACYRGFQLKNGKCIKQSASNGCIQYSQSSQCLKCQKRRYLLKGECKKIDDLCDTFNFIKNQCMTCYSGYSLIDGKCLISEVSQESQVANCYTYSLNGKCIECFERYYLKDNQCHQVNVFCKKYSPNSGQCTDCYTGFVLRQGKCLRK